MQMTVPGVVKYNLFVLCSAFVYGETLVRTAELNIFDAEEDTNLLIKT